MILNYAADILYILVALAIVVLFAYRGFFASVFHFGGDIAATLIACSVGPALSRFLYQKWIFSWIAAPVAEKVENFLDNTVGSVDIEGMIESLPALVKKFVDTEALYAKYGSAADNFPAVSEEFSATVSAPLATLLSNILAYAAVFFVSILILKLLFLALDKFFRSIPILNKINHFLGAVFGILAAFLALAAITWLLGVLISFFGNNEWLHSLAEHSRLFGFFEKLNIFNLFQ